jgi:eukaryotic-like serine/threonine-protein kinase
MSSADGAITKPLWWLFQVNDSNRYDVTQDLQGNPSSPDDAAPAQPLKQIGRYRIEKVLGKGGFGLVYLAHDEQLDRLVAIKVPHAKLISKPDDAEAYLAEARTVANLDHPHVVPVFDVGSTEDCPCYVVSKYIEGTDLSAKLKEGRLKYRDAAELVATVAEALHYAHKQGLVHRDVKPGNILIGKDGQPYVVDFGLALREENVGKGPKYAGTPAYMSPEQARGEGHRVDGRSDLFSLGVVFYELLAGRQPFRGDTQAELFEQVTSYEAKPLRQYDERLPKELERICHKAMAKRVSERYFTAKDLSEDLRHFLAEQTAVQHGRSPGGVTSEASETHASRGVAISGRSLAASSASMASMASGSAENQPIKIVPKGLRSFDAHDADFFLKLLPGPCDREGLPDSLRFWKTRIEEADADNTFSVGLMPTAATALRINGERSPIVETCKALPLPDHRACRDRCSVDYGYWHFSHTREPEFRLTLARSQAGAPEQVCQDFLRNK